MLRSSLYLLDFTMPQKISYTILTPRTGFVAYFTELNDIKSTTFFTDFAVLKAERRNQRVADQSRDTLGCPFFGKNSLGRSCSNCIFFGHGV